MRYLIGETSLWLIGLSLQAWGHGWISTRTSRSLTTTVVRVTIWLLGSGEPATGQQDG